MTEIKEHEVTEAYAALRRAIRRGDDRSAVTRDFTLRSLPTETGMDEPWQETRSLEETPEETSFSTRILTGQVEPAPQVVEAHKFVLNDASGNVRGLVGIGCHWGVWGG